MRYLSPSDLAFGGLLTVETHEPIILSSGGFTGLVLGPKRVIVFMQGGPLRVAVINGGEMGPL